MHSNNADGKFERRKTRCKCSYINVSYLEAAGCAIQKPSLLHNFIMEVN